MYSFGTPTLTNENIENNQSVYSYLPIYSLESIPSKWSLENFEVGKKLGSGAYGRVYLARDVAYKALVALKVISLSKIKKANMETQIRREIEIQSHLKHPNILKLYSYFYSPTHLFLITEYCPGGEVFKELTKACFHRYSELKASNYIKQVIHAVIYMHSKNVIHRDIKPENLLLSFGKIKLCDFGWSIHNNKSKRRNTVCGTKEYFAPEMLSGKTDYDYRIDIWCIGILAYEFLTGNTPFYNSNYKEMFQKIKSVVFTFPGYVSAQAKDFICKLLHKDPTQRITLKDSLLHPFITREFTEVSN